MGNHLSVAKGEPCFTVEDAINHVGFADIYALVAEVSASQIFVNPLNAYGVDAEQVWRLALSCGLAAELLAEQTGEDASVAYTVGLLHGVGMVGIDRWVQREAPEVLFLSNGPHREFIDAERGVMGFTQADVGACMLRQWDFPLTMIEPVRWQYSPRTSAGHMRTACLLHAAKWLRAVVCSDEVDCPPPLPDPSVLKPLNLTADKLVRSVIEVRFRLGAARNVVEASAHS
jgi:HD-like signal output (HDOD) protein